jgi:predicted nucleic acid-binding Zn finger protein
MILLTVKSEKKVFQEIYRKVTKTKNITEKQKKRMMKTFGTRFEKAYQTILDRKVKKYIFKPSEKQVWIVIGKGNIYQILPSVNFCSCNDFYFRVIGQEIFLCKHLIAQKLADALEKYVVIVKNEKEFESLMMKLRESPRIKRILSIEELENIRKITSEILSKEKQISITQIRNKLKKVNSTTLTTRHLTAILVTDKKKRFHCLKGLWSLAEE